MSHQWLDRFASLTPGMRQALADHMAEFGEQAPLTVLACGDLARSIVNDYPQLRETDLRAVFEEAERLMVEGGEGAKTAIATGFLEDLSHADGRDEFDMRTVAPFLGTASIAYIKAWDEFTGAQTRGLWD